MKWWKRDGGIVYDLAERSKANLLPPKEFKKEESILGSTQAKGKIRS